MAGYTTITVKGQEIGLRFGLPAIKRISDKINLMAGMEEITLNLMSMVHILYAGYLNDCLAKDLKPILENEDFYTLVEDAAMADDLSQVKKAIEVFAGSKEVKEVEVIGEKKEDIDWEEIEGFCIRKNRDFSRLTWREYVLLVRGHDKDRLDQLEDVRLIAYCAIYQFLKTGTSIESFMPLPSDRKIEFGSNEKMKELMEKVKEAHKKRFNPN